MTATVSPQHRAGRTPQRMTALERANGRRLAAAELKRQLAGLTVREARAEAARLLVEAPEQVGAVKIHAFLTAIPRVGDRQAQRLLTNRAEGWYVWPFHRVDELTDRQRERLARALGWRGE